MKRKESSESVNEISVLFSSYGIIIAVTSLKLTSSRCDVTENPPLKNPAYATATLLVIFVRESHMASMKK